jgi:hypothetical protein
MDKAIGFASSIILTLLGVSYLVTLVVSFRKVGLSFPPPPPVQLAGAIISILTSAALIFLMVVLRRQVAEERQVFVELAIVFMALLCVMTSANRFVQLGVLQKESASLLPAIQQLIHPYGSQSIMFALESLGWGWFYGLGALCAAFAFTGGGLALWIGWTFAVGGVFSLLFALGYLIRHPLLSLLGFPAWSILLTITSVLLAIWFLQV